MRKSWPLAAILVLGMIGGAFVAFVPTKEHASRKVIAEKYLLNQNFEVQQIFSFSNYVSVLCKPSDESYPFVVYHRDTKEEHRGVVCVDKRTNKPRYGLPGYTG